MTTSVDLDRSARASHSRPIQEVSRSADRVETKRGMPPGSSVAAFEELLDLAVGLGLLCTSFLGAVPGFLPMIALTMVVVVIVVIPMVIVGGVLGVFAGLGFLAWRLIAKARAFVGAGGRGN